MEIMPYVVLSIILLNLDYRSMLLVCELSHKLYNFCKQNLDLILRQILNKTTNLIIRDYNRRQLIHLCQSQSSVQIKNISAGSAHSLILDNNRQVYAFGNNDNGQLGLGDYHSKIKPTLIQHLTNVVQITAGNYYSLVLTNTGQIYSFGLNQDGQLGLSNDKQRNIPTLIPNLNQIIQIVAGNRHSLALTNNGQIYTFGSNDQGQLGLGDNIYNRNVPILIPNLDRIIQLAIGNSHSLTLSITGQIYAFGNNYSGQLGLGDKPRDNYMPKFIPNLINIIQIAAGYEHSLALSNTGQIYAFGCNYYRQLGLGGNTDIYTPTLIANLGRIEQISAGMYHSLIISNTNQIYAFGSNYYGQLGLEYYERRNIPTLMTNPTQILQVSAGSIHSLV